MDRRGLITGLVALTILPRHVFPARLVPIQKTSFMAYDVAGTPDWTSSIIVERDAPDWTSSIIVERDADDLNMINITINSELANRFKLHGHFKRWPFKMMDRLEAEFDGGPCTPKDVREEVIKYIREHNVLRPTGADVV